MFWTLKWRYVGESARLHLTDQGVKQVFKSDLHARFLFLSPPSLAVLETRLRGRGTDKEEDVQLRLQQAKVEMDFARSGQIHEKTVVNDDLNQAYKEVEQWILDENSSSTTN